MNTILITGATGLVGSALTRILQNDGYNPILLARHPLAAHKAASLGVDPTNFVQGDICKPLLGLTPSAYKKLAERIDTIFHLAARVDFKGRTLDDYRKTNVEGTHTIIQLVRDSGAILHYTGTAFISGTSESFTEEQFNVNQHFRNGYEESKFLAENAVRNFMANHPGQANIYRLAIILGRDAASSQATAFGPFFFMDAVFRMLLANSKDPDQTPLRILGDPDGHLPMLFADKTAEALVALSKNTPYGRTYHLVPQEALANSTLEDLFNQAFGRKVVEWSSANNFARKPASRPEKILAKKTAVYASYLALQVAYDRKNLESVLGQDSLPCPGEDEFLSAFADFLAAKNTTTSPSTSPQHDQIDAYFDTFLLQFHGRQLLENLVSLNADFWIEIDNKKTWSLQIINGRLLSISKGSQVGRFGYRTNTNTYLQVVRAQISPQEGFFRGAIKLAGNSKEALRTASALEEFFSKFPYHPADVQQTPTITEKSYA